MSEIIIQVKAVVPDGKEQEIIDRVTNYLHYADRGNGLTKMEFIQKHILDDLKEINTAAKVQEDEIRRQQLITDSKGEII